MRSAARMPNPAIIQPILSRTIANNYPLVIPSEALSSRAKPVMKGWNDTGGVARPSPCLADAGDSAPPNPGHLQGGSSCLAPRRELHGGRRRLRTVRVPGGGAAAG